MSAMYVLPVGGIHGGFQQGRNTHNPSFYPFTSPITRSLLFGTKVLVLAKRRYICIQPFHRHLELFLRTLPTNL